MRLFGQHNLGGCWLNPQSQRHVPAYASWDNQPLIQLRLLLEVIPNAALHTLQSPVQVLAVAQKADACGEFGFGKPLTRGWATSFHHSLSGQSCRYGLCYPYHHSSTEVSLPYPLHLPMRPSCHVRQGHSNRISPTRDGSVAQIQGLGPTSCRAFPSATSVGVEYIVTDCQALDSDHILSMDHWNSWQATL
jgi:hypothetical protein